MNISVISGSRADYGLLEWPIRALKADPFFSVAEVKIWGLSANEALERVGAYLDDARPEMVLVLGDRFEILSAVIAAHLLRVPVAHIAGGDVTEGSYDDAMRDAISKMASIHFVTSTSAMSRLTHMGYRNIHLVGNPGIDYIKHGSWKGPKPFEVPYVVVSYQAETIDGTNDIEKVIASLPEDKGQVFFYPNTDTGSDAIRAVIKAHVKDHINRVAYEYLPHDEFLNLIYHCDEFIGNSSSMLYEAPELNVRTRMIGKRQKGRTIPMGDGHASERILKILKYTV